MNLFIVHELNADLILKDFLKMQIQIINSYSEYGVGFGIC